MITLHAILARIRSAWRIIRGRRPMPGRHYVGRKEWRSQFAALRSEGYVIKHGFCPRCGAYQLAACFPVDQLMLGECPACRVIETEPGSAVPLAWEAINPEKLPMYPAALPLMATETLFRFAGIDASPEAVKTFWRLLNERRLSQDES